MMTQFNLTNLGFKKEDIKEHPKDVVFERVVDVIESGKYIHFKNDSIINLINNFSNIYKCRESTKQLNNLYEEKLKTFENN